VAAIRKLDPDSLKSSPLPPLRVAWFGHASGRRADGLSEYSSATVSALHARGAKTQFFSHVADGPVAPSLDHVQLQSMRFKTVTWSLPGSLDRIDRALDRFQPDVMHVSISFSLLEGTLRSLAHYRGIPTVATVHLPYALSGTSRGRVLRGLYRFHARHLAGYDRCIALSDEQRELLIAAGVDSQRITVIPNGIDLDGITPGASPLSARGDGGLVVVFMGRLDPEKRVAALVRSFLALGWPQSHRLFIAGAGSQERRIRNLATGHPNVRVLGMLSDPQARLELLRAADIVVLPSTAEGLSLSLLEAMAAGAAVIATDAGENGAALGDAGILLPVYPLEPALGAALRRLGEDAALRAALGRRARVRVETDYSLQLNVERLMHVYGELAARSAAA
jgi:glycosyltransferase involved in cell wall biosynthesis